MKQGALFAVIVAAAGLGATAPAMADYVRIGSVDVGFRADRDVAYSRFGGAVESLRLVADHSDITCRSIILRYEGGRVDNVFSGRLREDRPINIDVPGRAKKVESIRFVCRSDEHRGGRIYVNAEVGRFRSDWQRHGGWGTLFGLLAGPAIMSGPHSGPSMGPGPHPGPAMGPGRATPSGWVTISRETFEGTRDREGASAGWRGHQIDKIGLRPLNADASCSRVTVFFANGHRKDLSRGPTRTMRAGSLTVLDLPGGDRDVERVTLACRALNHRQVTIEVMGRK